ncbi:MAG: hypothetical protein EHM41_13750 [Chloroflexi bacterium]|nr:MAG: hypothetical protein EHM41_13750 [Chloroflexota bacterium]
MNNSVNIYSQKALSFLWKKLADELTIESESYRKLSLTSKKLRDAYGENEALYVKQRYLHHLDTIYNKYMEDGTIYDLSKEMLAELKSERENLRENMKLVEQSDLPEEAVNILRQQRVKLIRSAIRGGIIVPSKVLEEYPQGTFGEDFECLSRYGKACYTVFSNRLGHVDNSLVDDFGCRVRRQDGRRVSNEERDEIKTCLEEVFRAVGDLSTLMEATRLTIVHTGGKHIFRYPRYILGAYQSRDQSITFGVKDQYGRTVLSSFAHELVGHWLDTISTPPQAWIDSLFDGEFPYLREVIHTSFVDASIGREGSIYLLLILHMNLADDTCPDGMRPSSTSSELWARFAEQFISEELRAFGVDGPASVCPPESYYKTAGYWQEELWAGMLKERAREQIQARIWMAAKLYGLNHSSFEAASPTYNQIFPWSDGLKLS